MRFHAGLFLLAGVGALVVGMEPVAPGWNPDEVRASLFDEETIKLNSSVERVAHSVDVAATVDRWTRADRAAEASARPKTVVDGLVALTTIAFQPAAPLSVGGSGANGPVGCSVTATVPNATACSSNTPGATTGASCSTSGTTSTATTCSTNVAPAPAPNGGNNTTCSALSTTAGYCSATAGGTGGQAATCSTGGGQTVPPGSNGAVGCSAAAGGTGNNNSCSTNGTAAGSTCSTYAGQHQSCSSGYTPGGTTAMCSAAGGATSQASNCSVQAAGSTGIPAAPVYGNQCTAISFGNGTATGGTANCSVAAGSTGSCSVSAGNTGGTNNTQCTTFAGTTAPGSTPTTLQCSAFSAPGKPTQPGGGGGNCSVINPTGPVTPPKGGICGGPYTGE